jgi:hypothetical protein
MDQQTKSTINQTSPDPQKKKEGFWSEIIRFTLFALLDCSANSAFYRSTIYRQRCFDGSYI